MNDKELRKYLLREEKQPFQGWDFSYLDGRWESENISWDYAKIVNLGDILTSCWIWVRAEEN